MIKLKQILVTALSALITLGLGLSVMTYADDDDAADTAEQDAQCDEIGDTFATALHDDEVRDRYVEMGYSMAKYCYHRSMNNLFNSKVEVMIELLDKENRTSDEEAQLHVPGGLKVASEPVEDGENISAHEYNREICAEAGNNVSSYCLSIEALDYYVGYLKVLNQLKSRVPVLNYAVGEDSPRFSELLKLTDKRNQSMEEQVEEARQVMEMSLAAYNELRLAYPMHKEYEKIIQSLVKYKLKLKSVRRQVLRFPAEFIDSTAIQCR